MPFRIIQSAPPPPKKVSVAEDVVKSSLTGQLEGWAGLPGFTGDITAFGEAALAKIYDMAGAKGAKPKLRSLIPEGMRLPGDAAVAILKTAGVDPRIAKLVNALQFGGPTSSELVGAVTQDRELYKPQTRAGRYARTINQFTPAAVAPGTWVQKAAQVVVPGAASEAAGELTAGTPMEPWARLAAAVLGSGAVSAVTAPRPDTRLLAEAARGADEQQIAAARQLMEQAQARGLRLTMAEALQQVTNNGTGMGRLQRVVEGTEGGNARIGPVMAQRPDQVRNAVTQFADNIAPAADDPYMAASRAQESAKGVLTDVRQAINANARPWYDALAQERMPPTPAAAQLTRNPAYQEALQAVRGNNLLNADLANLPDESLAVVDAVVKQLDEMARNVAPNPASPTGNAQMQAAYEAARRSADELASAYSEPWRLSRAMVASQREAFLDPLQAGPMGAVSNTGKPGSQTAALFPNAPVEGAAAPTSQALQMLPDDVGRDLVRRQVMTGFNEAAQDLSTGPNQWGGAGWAARQFGNAEQAATLRGGVEAVGGSSNDLDALVQALQATGRRQAPGSLTAYNARDLERLGEAGAIGEALRTGLNPPGFFRQQGAKFQQWQTERNAGRLAEAILASPAEAEAILLHARRVVPEGPGLVAIERAALAAQQSRQHRLEGR